MEDGCQTQPSGYEFEWGTTCKEVDTNPRLNDASTLLASTKGCAPKKWCELKGALW